MRTCQAERGLTDAELVEAGAASEQSNFSDYMNGKAFPGPRRLVQFVDAFARLGKPLWFMQQQAALYLYLEESPAWDRWTATQPGWVSETDPVEPLRGKRANRESREGHHAEVQ